MLSEALLSYFHLASILAMVVFLTSEGALCRPEWFNEAVLKRLQRVDIIYMICGAMVATRSAGSATPPPNLPAARAVSR